MFIHVAKAVLETDSTFKEDKTTIAKKIFDQLGQWFNLLYITHHMIEDHVTNHK
jgi:hypothetical protein